MKTTPTIFAVTAGMVLLAAYAQSETQPAPDVPVSAKEAAPDQNTALLWTYSGNYKMTPPPTLHSTSIRFRIDKVELLKGPGGGEATKITYSPSYGKITAESETFRKAHETQSVSLLVDGDQTAKVREGDLLRSCFYPN